MQKLPTVRRSARPLTSFVVAGLMTVSGPMSLLLATQVAHAQAGSDDDPEVIAQAKEHYKAGLAAYQAGKYDVAIRELKKAYAAKRLAPLLLNIGATYRKIGDLDLSLHFYQKYLDEAPSDSKDRPEVEKIIAELKVAKAAQATDDSTGVGEVPQPRESRRAGGEWKHTVIDAAPPETPIDVRVSTPPMKGVKVFVYFRSAGQADFSSVLMKRRGQEKVGRIPAEAVTGRSLQYYIEAKDASGTVVKSAGDSGNPNIIMIEEGVKPVMIASSRRVDDDAEETSEEDAHPKRHVSNDDDSVPSGANLNERPGAAARHKEKKVGQTTALQIAGYGLLAGGGLFTIAGGALVGISKHEQNVLVADSKSSTAASPIYWNNDPNFNGTQEKAHDATARTENRAGIAVLSIGILGALAGAGCLIADAVTRTDSSSHHAKKKSKKKHRAAEDEEESSNWYVAPSLGPSVAGVTGGFTF
ncbi:MAG: tetratricopeptide repeat protein [Polyangia bacterium]